MAFRASESCTSFHRAFFIVIMVTWGVDAGRHRAKMKISKQEVERVAQLARLEITESEKDAFTRQLSTILTYIEELKSWDTAGVEPTATVLDQTNVLREDRARPSLAVEQAVMNAPDSDGGYFRVPSILEER